MEKRRHSLLNGLLASILSGTPGAPEVREFVELCCDLALPVVRKRIALGKLNLHALGLNETDVVYDCLAELFQRDAEGRFPHIQRYVEKNIPAGMPQSDEQLVVILRGLIIGRINDGLIRLYQETDPVFGRILRNIRLALERSEQFVRETRFNDVYIFPAGIDPLLHRPPVPYEYLKDLVLQIVRLDDNVPQMLRKMHVILCEQEEYQRGVRLITAAVLFKEIYGLAQAADTDAKIVQPEPDAGLDLPAVVGRVCGELRAEMRETYVAGEKVSEELFEKYFLALNQILLSGFGLDGTGEKSYFDHLRDYVPGLTRESYTSDHRTTVEYLAKLGKQRVREYLVR
ncbi:MAG TPA: hypothetical protein VMW43_09490 [Bacteroidota bacterium]|nr:hypothetical protein [Bacteroidota bacterium]